MIEFLRKLAKERERERKVSRFRSGLRIPRYIHRRVDNSLETVSRITNDNYSDNRRVWNGEIPRSTISGSRPFSRTARTANSADCFLLRRGSFPGCRYTVAIIRRILRRLRGERIRRQRWDNDRREFSHRFTHGSIRRNRRL